MVFEIRPVEELYEIPAPAERDVEEILLLKVDQSPEVRKPLVDALLWLIEKTPVATAYESGPVAEIEEEARRPRVFVATADTVPLAAERRPEREPMVTPPLNAFDPVKVLLV